MTDEPMTVAEVEALLEGTTPGPWRGHHYEGRSYVHSNNHTVQPSLAHVYSSKNTALMAAAPDLAAALIAALGERDEAIRLLRDLLDDEYAEEMAPDVYLGGIREHHIMHRDAAAAFLASHPVAPQPEDG